MSDQKPGEITVLLRAWHAGDENAYRELSSLLYGEPRQLAARYMRRQAPGDTLQATALVHEAFMRLVDAGDWRMARTWLLRELDAGGTLR